MSSVDPNQNQGPRKAIYNRLKAWLPGAPKSFAVENCLCNLMSGRVLWPGIVVDGGTDEEMKRMTFSGQNRHGSSITNPAQALAQSTSRR